MDRDQILHLNIADADRKFRSYFVALTELSTVIRIPLEPQEFPFAERQGETLPVGGIPDVVVDRVGGLLVRPKRPTEIVDALRVLEQDRGLRSEMARSNRRRASTLYTADAHRAAMLDVFGAVACEHRERGRKSHHAVR